MRAEIWISEDDDKLFEVGFWNSLEKRETLRIARHVTFTSRFWEFQTSPAVTIDMFMVGGLDSRVLIGCCS